MRIFLQMLYEFSKFSKIYCSFSTIILIAAIFLRVFPFQLNADNTVVIRTKNNSYAGIVINENKSSFVYSTYDFLLEDAAFKIEDNSGKIIHFLSTPFIADENACVKIKLAEFFKNAPQLRPYTQLNIDGNATIENSFLRKEVEIMGINKNFFEFNFQESGYCTGTPIFQNDNFIGLISNNSINLQVQNYWSEHKLSISKNLNISAIRVYSSMHWSSLGNRELRHKLKLINESNKLLKPFINLINFWMLFPYRPFPENFLTHPSLSPWLKEHNERTKTHDKILKKIRLKPSVYVGLIDNITQCTLQRGKRLQSFCSTKIQQLKINSKIHSIQNILKKHLSQWLQINRILKNRIKNFHYLLPSEILKLNKKSMPRTHKTHSKKRVIVKKTKPENKSQIYDKLLIIEKNDSTEFLSAIVNFKSELFAVASQSSFFEKPALFNFFSLKSHRLIKFSTLEYSSNNPIIRIKISNNHLSSIPIATISSKPAVCISMNPISFFIHTEKIQSSNLNKNLKFSIQAGGLLLNSNQEIVGIPVRFDNLFPSSKKQYKIARLNNNSWHSIEYLRFLKAARKLHNYIKKSNDLINLFNNLKFQTYIELPSTMSPFFQKWILQHNANVMKRKLAGKLSRKNHFIKHKYQCLFYNEIIQLESYFKNLLEKSSEYPTPYFTQKANYAKNRIKNTLKKLLLKEKDFLEKYPATRPAL